MHGYGFIPDSTIVKKQTFYVELPVFQSYYAISKPTSDRNFFRKPGLRNVIGYGYTMQKGGEYLAML